MKQKQFDHLGVGDMLTHETCPWSNFVCVHKMYNDEGWYVIRACNSGVLENFTVTSPKGWILTSKVQKRKSIGDKNKRIQALSE